MSTYMKSWMCANFKYVMLYDVSEGRCGHPPGRQVEALAAGAQQLPLPLQRPAGQVRGFMLDSVNRVPYFPHH